MKSVVESWTKRVDAHHSQTRAAQSAIEHTKGSTSSMASYFAADPKRVGDSILDRLLLHVAADDTVLDVGGGSGRYALPIALKARHVTVVEPSSDMMAELQSGAEKADITNVLCVHQPWQLADVASAEVVLCASVVDGVADIQPFIEKLAAHSKREVVVLQSLESPLAAMSDLWQEVHGESRIDPPGALDLVRVLWEMDILPDFEMLEPQPVPAILGRDNAMDFLSQMLYVSSESEKGSVLADACDRHLVETPRGFSLRGAKPRQMAIVSWRSQ